MARPLLQLGVGQLEDMFAQNQSDPTVLRQLENELQYRQVPRAIALLAEVQAAMYGVAPVAPPAVTPALPPGPVDRPVRHDLWSRSPAEPPPPPPAAKPMQPAPPAVPPMAVADAYKLLKATPGSTWESIEQTRRQLVQQSSPARTGSMSVERRAQLQAEARRVNAAYAAVAQHRAGRS